MVGILIKIGVNALAIWIAAYFVDGMDFNTASIVGVIVVGAIFGLINAVLKPIVTILALPAVLLTLGLLTFVINALMLWLTASVTSALTIEGFGAALLGSIIVSIASFVLSMVVPE